jgi:uncharacterized protein YtpQ (UPF0354 family)
MPGISNVRHFIVNRHPIFPVIVPRSYFASGAFTACHLDLRHPDLGVTWVEIDGPHSMTYVNPVRQAQLASSIMELHELAMQDLREAGHPVTHEKVVEKTCWWLALNHDDGLGSSRLLMLDELRKAVPRGFRLAIPERSCGFLVPNGREGASLAEATALISRCHSAGAIPVLDSLFEPDCFLIANA